MVSIAPGQRLVFAGSEEPAAFLELRSIGLPDAKRGSLCTELTDLIAEFCGIAKSVFCASLRRGTTGERAFPARSQQSPTSSGSGAMTPGAGESRFHQVLGTHWVQQLSWTAIGIKLFLASRPISSSPTPI
jgi:hypothetical protein